MALSAGGLRFESGFVHIFFFASFFFFPSVSIYRCSGQHAHVGNAQRLLILTLGPVCDLAHFHECRACAV